MKRSTKKAIKQTFTVSIVILSILISVSLLPFTEMNEQRTERKTAKTPAISKEVLQYKPVVQLYAEKYGVESYIDVLLAMMMQESGGRGLDPMQSSESYCGYIGCITDPDQSIQQGVYYFSENLKAANGDIELAIQSYNFGKGFITYVKEHAGSFTQEIAIQFSREMYEKAEDQSIYSCMREGAKQYDACYGDIYYVRDVMAYREVFSSK
ncbi:lysozyme family protein [Virgibacillus sp. W0430]|uniref:lysozyme family protein n=1 Tax=Virgibacillus sp. W0430 TaxID=3391580 RepID=UPI003F46A289